MNKLLVIAKIY